jgi:hypothetical protein
MSDDAVQPALESIVTAGTPGNGETDSRRYWRAAISHLSDPQKRDAAWEFYLRRLEARKSGDTLSALVLLLEANGAFLTTTQTATLVAAQALATSTGTGTSSAATPTKNAAPGSFGRGEKSMGALVIVVVGAMVAL